MRPIFRMLPFFLFGAAILTHIAYIDKIPQDVRGDVLFDRLRSAIFSLFLLPVVYLISQKLSRSKFIAYFSVLFLVTMPWHVEQSRVISPVTEITLVTSVFIYLLLAETKRLMKLIILSAYLFTLPWFYPTLWLFHDHVQMMNFGEVLKNLFYSVSSDFLFFANNSFRLGSLRVYGIMLWETIPLFLMGLYALIVSTSKFQRRTLFFWIMLPVLMACFNPVYSGIEVYIATPFFAIILGFGSQFLYHNFISTKKIILRGLIIFYLILVINGFLNFVHFYVRHYPLRIRKEANYELKRF